MNQTFEEFERKSLASEKCEPLNETYDRYQNFRITYSPPQRISVIELLFNASFVENATINGLNCTLSISPYRNCVLIMKSPIFRKHKWVFICEFKSFEDYKNETISPTIIQFSFKSEKNFYLEICGIRAYRFPNDCGIPDMPLHASHKKLNDTSFEYFSTQRNKYRMIGDSVITCAYEGNWDKELPIFEPIIKCNASEIDVNSSIYKNIKLENFELFNRTKVAVIDSKILFECNNEENSSKIHVLLCNENGLWIGDHLKCKL
jgi:hypothetical protein